MSDAIDTPRSGPQWVRFLYAVLAVATIALITMLLKELIQRLEGDEGEIHHLAVFDIAWVVFLPTAAFSLLAAIVLLPLGLIRRDRRLTRYARWVGVMIAVAVAAIVAEELSTEAPGGDQHEEHVE